MRAISALYFFTILKWFLCLGCDSERSHRVSDITLVDTNATSETRGLYRNLNDIRTNHVLFGHQDALAYGVHWINEPGRSDARDVTGSYPAVYGWDLGDLELGKATNLDGVRFDKMHQWIREAYERGGINTISWHMNNPATGGNAWDIEGGHRVVSKILPGGAHHQKFRSWLDTFANFALSLRAHTGTENEHFIPVIFRPYHEHTGSWFWWGADHCTPDEFITLWRFTVEYLRDEKGVHNILWAFSPTGEAADSKGSYLERYPGDEYVDIIGIDDYASVRRPYQLEQIRNRLRFIVQCAETRGKIPALTETGYEGIPDPNWWTEVLLAALDHDSTTRRIAYVLLWRNANETTDRIGHYYVPFPGHPGAGNFIEFRSHPLILFEDDLPQMYGWDE